jgi:hypothetical protein
MEDRLFNRINQEPEVPEGSSTPVSLPNVIQQIVSNPALPQVEGELRNRFNTRNPSTRSTPSVPPTATPALLYNPFTPYGRPRTSSGRRRKRTVHNVFKDEPAERIIYKDFILLPVNTKNTPRGKERSRLETEGFVVHAVPLKQNQTEKEIEEVVNTIFADKLARTSTGGKRYCRTPIFWFYLITNCFLFMHLLNLAVAQYSNSTCICTPGQQICWGWGGGDRHSAISSV